MPAPTQLMFLPGAGGNAEFWRPVSTLLLHPAPRKLIGWPGFGAEPPDPTITGIDDLVTRIVTAIDQPTALIAQSMGGIIAVRATLARPTLVTHLILTVTSGGLDISDLGAQDWRPDFIAERPTVPRWFIDERVDLSSDLSAIRLPVLLLWGDCDPISPVAVGQRLQQYLPHAVLQVIAGGEHDLACRLAQQVAPLIDRHLRVDCE